MKYILSILIVCCAASALCSPYSDLISIDESRVKSKDRPTCLPKGDNAGIMDFFEGLWYGLRVTFQYDWRYINWCTRMPVRLITVWSNVTVVIKEFIDKWEIFKLYDSFKEMSLQSQLYYFPCYMLNNLIKHFLTWFDVEDLSDLKSRIINSLLSNAQMMLNDVMAMFTCLGNGDFYCVGANLGQILYVIAFH